MVVFRPVAFPPRPTRSFATDLRDLRAVSPFSPRPPPIFIEIVFSRLEKILEISSLDKKGDLLSIGGTKTVRCGFPVNQDN